MAIPGNPERKTVQDDDFDDDLFGEDALSSDIESDFDMLSEEELNGLFDDSDLDESDETLPGNKSFEKGAKGSSHSQLPDDWKDFDFGDDDVDF